MFSVDEQQIADLVRVFYERARAHPDLGRLFEATISDWDTHLQIVRDFWSDTLLGTHRYRRHAYPAHVGLGIERQHFDQWLGLFREAAQESLPPEVAARAIGRAQLMTRSFRAGLFPFDPPQSN
jgi:hemoglobin